MRGDLEGQVLTMEVTHARKILELFLGGLCDLEHSD